MSTSYKPTKRDSYGMVDTGSEVHMVHADSFRSLDDCDVDEPRPAYMRPEEEEYGGDHSVSELGQHPQQPPFAEYGDPRQPIKVDEETNITTVVRRASRATRLSFSTMADDFQINGDDDPELQASARHLENQFVREDSNATLRKRKWGACICCGVFFTVLVAFGTTFAALLYQRGYQPGDGLEGLATSIKGIFHSSDEEGDYGQDGSAGNATVANATQAAGGTVQGTGDDTLSSVEDEESLPEGLVEVGTQQQDPSTDVETSAPASSSNEQMEGEETPGPPPAPANLLAVCTAPKTETASNNICLAACAAAMCCQSTCMSHSNCFAYHPCLALLAEMGGDIPSFPGGSEVDEESDQVIEFDSSAFNGEQSPGPPPPPANLLAVCTAPKTDTAKNNICLAACAAGVCCQSTCMNHPDCSAYHPCLAILEETGGDIPNLLDAGGGEYDDDFNQVNDFDFSGFDEEQTPTDDDSILVDPYVMDLCARENIVDSLDGRLECMEVCKERACCFYPRNDEVGAKKSCYLKKVKWCQEYTPCTNLKKYAPGTAAADVGSGSGGIGVVDDDDNNPKVDLGDDDFNLDGDLNGDMMFVGQPGTSSPPSGGQGTSENDESKDPSSVCSTENIMLDGGLGSCEDLCAPHRCCFVDESACAPMESYDDITRRCEDFEPCQILFDTIWHDGTTTIEGDDTVDMSVAVACSSTNLERDGGMADCSAACQRKTGCCGIFGNCSQEEADDPSFCQDFSLCAAVGDGFDDDDSPLKYIPLVDRVCTKENLRNEPGRMECNSLCFGKICCFSPEDDADDDFAYMFGERCYDDQPDVCEENGACFVLYEYLRSAEVAPDDGMVRTDPALAPGTEDRSQEHPTLAVACDPNTLRGSMDNLITCTEICDEKICCLSSSPASSSIDFSCDGEDIDYCQDYHLCQDLLAIVDEGGRP